MLFSRFPARVSRRSTRASFFSSEVSALESRELPSASAHSSVVGLQNASSDKVGVNSKTPPLDFGGSWEVNGSTSVILTLIQNNHGKVTGMLSSTNGISVDLHGKADTHLSLKGKGVINGATGRFTFLSNSTQVQFGVLKHFAGNISFTVKGFDPVLDTLTADRI